MRTTRWLSPLLWLLLNTAALAATPDQKIALVTESLRRSLIDTRRDLHIHPELSNREERTAQIIADRLRALGLTVKTGIARHGVVGVLQGGKPGPLVAWRADIDALPIDETLDVPYRSQNPGVKHACGHDAHTAIGLAAAELLARLRADLPGRVMFIFQPAEEGPPPGEKGGASLMLDEGLFATDRPEAIFALHAWPLEDAGTIAYKPGPIMAAADRFFVKIRGKQTHGAFPHQGVDAVLAAAQSVVALQTVRSRRTDPIDPLVISVGSIHGGNRFNIIAEEVTLEGTVRTLSPQLHAQIPALMREALNGATASVGASAELQVEQLTPVTSNDSALTGEAVRSLTRILGADRLVLVPARMGAEDFGYFAEKIPGFYFFLGVGNKARGLQAMIHTPDFDIDEESLLVGTRCAATLLWDWLDHHKSAR